MIWEVNRVGKSRSHEVQIRNWILLTVRIVLVTRTAEISDVPKY